MSERVLEGLAEEVKRYFNGEAGDEMLSRQITSDEEGIILSPSGSSIPLKEGYLLEVGPKWWSVWKVVKK